MRVCRWVLGLLLVTLVGRIHAEYTESDDEEQACTSTRCGSLELFVHSGGEVELAVTSTNASAIQPTFWVDNQADVPTIVSGTNPKQTTLKVLAESEDIRVFVTSYLNTYGNTIAHASTLTSTQEVASTALCSMPPKITNSCPSISIVKFVERPIPSCSAPGLDSAVCSPFSDGHGAAGSGNMTTAASRELELPAAAALWIPLLVVFLFLAMLCEPRTEELEIITPESSRLIPRFVSACPSLHIGYFPPFGLSRGIIHTIFSSKVRRGPVVVFHRELLATPDGGTLSLDWTIRHGTKELGSLRAKGLVIILHGLVGGSQENYVRSFVVVARRAGYECLVINSRGCSDSSLTSPRAYNAGWTHDVHYVTHLISSLTDLPLFGYGVSLGASMLTNYLGESGDGTPLRGAVVAATPFDLPACSVALQFGWRRLLSRALAANMIRVFGRHLACLSELPGLEPDKISRARSVREFDSLFVCPMFGFPTVGQWAPHPHSTPLCGRYYRRASSIDKILDVKVPLLCLNADDDPVAPGWALPRAEVAVSSHVTLVVTKHGGHVGWCTDYKTDSSSWGDGAAVEFLDAVADCPLTMS